MFARACAAAACLQAVLVPCVALGQFDALSASGAGGPPVDPLAGLRVRLPSVSMEANRVGPGGTFSLEEARAMGVKHAPGARYGCSPVPIECLPGTTPADEGEVRCFTNYDDVFNTGCNAVPPQFRSRLDVGECVRGTSGILNFGGSTSAIPIGSSSRFLHLSHSLSMSRRTSTASTG